MPLSQMEKFDLSSIRAKMDWTGVVNRWVGLRPRQGLIRGAQRVGGTARTSPRCS